MKDEAIQGGFLEEVTRGCVLKNNSGKKVKGRKKMSQVEGTEAHSGGVLRGLWEWGRV